jgi:hypothetical protein
MAWLGRKRKPPTGPPPLATDEPLESWRRRVTEAGLRLVEIKEKDQAVYQTLTCDDPEKAKDFLMKERVGKRLYYIVVDTPDGSWGLDIDGLFLEGLRPWQKDTANADCRGMISGTVDNMQSIRAAALGHNDNWVTIVSCGRCDHSWVDGVRYQDLTLVRCPACRARNVIDSSSSHFYPVDEPADEA